MVEPSEPIKPRRPRMWRAISSTSLGVIGFCMTGWGLLAISYSNLPIWLRTVVAIVFGACSVWMLLFIRPRWRGCLVFLTLFLALTAWWLSIPPSNDRDWQKDVTVLPYAVIEGDQLKLYNIRNCDYRSETDFDVQYYDRTYDLNRLRTVDLYVVYWGSPRIAHTMMSFGFGEKEYVCISIETRKEKGEQYSAIRGFFKQYELTYVIADERDLVRLRTNYRGEQVYLYRLKASPEAARDVLLSYLSRANQLKDHPEWYNALTSNCTTNIRGHARAYAASPWDWRILLNGYVDEMAYENGRLDQSLPFAELKARSLINERAKAADQDPAFSSRIRAGLPGMEKR